MPLSSTRPHGLLALLWVLSLSFLETQSWMQPSRLLRLSARSTQLCMATTNSHEQFELFQRHLGKWKGISVCHDYSGDEDGRDEEREMRESRSIAAVSFAQSDDKKEITHKSYFVDAANLDWTTRESLPPHQIKVVPQATQIFQAAGKIGSAAFCANAALGGPNVVANTHELTFQISLVDGDARLRVLIIYDTFDVVNVPSSSFLIPLSFVISDVVITREVREEATGEGVFLIAPAELNSLLSTPADELQFADMAIDASTIRRYAVLSKDARQTEEGATKEHPAVRPGGLIKLSDRAPIKFQSEKIVMPGTQSVYDPQSGVVDEMDDDDDDEDEEISMLVSQTHRDVQIELPRVILAGESVSCRVTWYQPQSKTVHSAEVFFSAAHGALRPVKRRGGLNEQFDQPVLEGLYVTTGTVMGGKR